MSLSVPVVIPRSNAKTGSRCERPGDLHLRIVKATKDTAIIGLLMSSYRESFGARKKRASPSLSGPNTSRVFPN